MQNLIEEYPKPVFRNTYNIVCGVNHFNGINFDYCDNCKQWVAMKHGDEIGLLNKTGVEYAEHFLNPLFKDVLLMQGYTYNPFIFL